MSDFLNLGTHSIPAALVPVLVFFARLADVSLGTLRIIVVGRGMRLYASLLGFLEVFIWLLAISQVLQHLSGWYSYLMYSAGFAVGTYMGMTIERRLKLGYSIIRIVAPRQDGRLADELRNLGHRVTHLDATGTKGPVELIFSVVRGDGLRKILDSVQTLRPDAFYTIEDVRTARNGDAANADWMPVRRLLQPFYWFRKSK
jgi:uncharacterized protein YebE (UPF0316 family)